MSLVARRAILVLHIAALLLPAMHDLLLEDDDCIDCLEILEGGPVLGAACGGDLPCEDPRHHHHDHRGHDHGQCPTCQKGLHLDALIPAVLAGPEVELSAHHPDSFAPRRPDRLFLKGHPARGPPAIS